ncbi:TRAP transporter large permease [Fulvivirga sedimenti]|uniref:TRAP transporter large permease n=1 Tax=Fulvivirga sedimenti TaxID=2879465 RepID=A0A9X1L1X3_9BACT|nr:TRAP transporter large permease [Fulvivirga sedimenti]MCA6078692.1 TRAP transporter large permease [Fulvivirga sedimenti]
MGVNEVLILLLSFFVLLAIGVPVAYSIGLSSLFTLLVSMPSLPAVTTLAQRIATGLDSFALLAIPFFILSGQLMNRGGIATRLIDFAKVLVGRLPGGLAYVNILACMLFGAISGSAVAAASAIGGFMIPRMEEEGYDKSFSAAVNLTSATTGLIIPPSNILIIYSLASGGASIAALFLAGYIPGLLIGAALMVVAGILSRKTKVKTERITISRGLHIMLRALPSLVLLLIVIGGIVAGIFTATEASAIAVLYTFILAFLYKEITTRDIPSILLETVKTTSIVMLLIGTSMGMSWVMSYENIPQDLTSFMMGISDNPIIILLIINAILLAVGIFMDITPSVLIFTPIFLPVVTELGMSPIHFGIIMVMNLCIGLCTPPVGSVLFVGCSVAGVKIRQVLRPLVPMFLAMLVVLLLTTFIPSLSTWIPSLFGF